MKWGIHWKYKLGIYAVFTIGAVLYFILAMQLASVESERDVLRERIVELEVEIANYDTCLVMCHEQLMMTTNFWNKCRGDTAKKFVRVKDVGMMDGELLDSAALDSIYQKIIEKPLQKWIDEH